MKKNEIIVFYSMLFRKVNGKYYCNGAFGRYIDQLSKKFDMLYLCVPVKKYHTNSYIDYNLKSKNIIIQELPEYDSYFSAIKNQKNIKRKIIEYSNDWNSTIMVRWPSPFFSLVNKISKRKLLPIIYHLVADTTKVIKEGNKYKGIMKIIALYFSIIQDIKMKKILKKAPALFNGSGLRRLYDYKEKRFLEIRTSTFYSSEISWDIRKINTDKIKILYVGYLRPEKGINYLIDSINDLTKKGKKVYLTIIGKGIEKEKLIEQTKKLGISENINFLDHIVMGKKLFQEFKKNNIFVLPSISEGTPRVLIEAMANGLITIGTNVGGIPHTIKDNYNGFLIPSKNSNVISNKILEILDNENAQIKIIKNGYKFASENSIEKHVDEVLGHIGNECLKVSEYIYKEKISKKILRVFLNTLPIHIIQLITSLLPNTNITQKLRGFLLRPFFKYIGKGVKIANGVTFIHSENISLGKNVYIANNCWINGTGGVIIEEDSLVGPFSVIASTKHQNSKKGFINKNPIVSQIRIGNGTWISSHCVISRSVNIGDGSLISAGSIVTKNVKEKTMVGGVPAKKIKEIGVLSEKKN